jgi:hypothetical protein
VIALRPQGGEPRPGRSRAAGGARPGVELNALEVPAELEAEGLKPLSSSVYLTRRGAVISIDRGASPPLVAKVEYEGRIRIQRHGADRFQIDVGDLVVSLEAGGPELRARYEPKRTSE